MMFPKLAVPFEIVKLTVWLAKPIYEIINCPEFTLESIVNLPSKPVEALADVPEIATFAPGNVLCPSVIVPVIFPCENTVDTIKNSNPESNQFFIVFILVSLNIFGKIITFKRTNVNKSLINYTSSNPYWQKSQIKILSLIFYRYNHF